MTVCFLDFADSLDFIWILFFGFGLDWQMGQRIERGRGTSDPRESFRVGGALARDGIGERPQANSFNSP